MNKIKLEHIDALSRGHKSGIRIGSRSIPHHLFLFEREEYERALKRGYLILDKKSRPNLKNIWTLVSKVYARECIILHKVDERGLITAGEDTIFEGSLHEAKKYLKSHFRSE